MTHDQALAVYALIAAAWPAWKANEGTVGVWIDMLADLDYEPCVQAAKELIATDEGWPSIAKLRRRYLHVAHGMPPDPDEAWLEAATQARRLGMYHGPPESWSHPAVAATVASIGWERICLDERPEIVRVQFLRTYETVSDREQQRALVGSDLPAISPAMREVLGDAADHLSLPDGDHDG